MSAADLGMARPPMNTARDLLCRGTRVLAAAGSDQAEAEAETLLCHLLACTRVTLYLDSCAVSDEMQQRYRGLLARRAAGEPVQHICGRTCFRGRDFVVKPGVFIPRPETEQIVEALLERLRRLPEREAGASLSIVEFGTGSGCIAVSLALEFQPCTILGIDVSYTALCAAAENARRLGASDIRWMQSNWDSALTGRFDCLVSNPPYIPLEAVGSLPAPVRRDPLNSLEGGPDGWRDLSHLLRGAARLLSPGGILALECGEDQAEELSERARRLAWVAETEMIVDLCGRPRGIIAARRSDA